MNLKGHFLVPAAKNPDKSLWFIFHHESDGILAVDLAHKHPDLPYRYFEHFADHEPREKIVLLGGPLQEDTAMIVLHNDPKAAPDPHAIDKNFSFFSRKFVLVSGQEPQFTNAQEVPSKIMLAPTADFLITMGFRLWNINDLERELADWHWTILPADPAIVFRTAHENRLEKARRAIN